MTTISSDVIRGYNDTMILYLLLDHDSYGYEISKEIRRISEDKYVIKETTLYSAFNRMERNGYITSGPKYRKTQNLLSDYRAWQKLLQRKM